MFQGLLQYGIAMGTLVQGLHRVVSTPRMLTFLRACYSEDASR